MVSSNVRRNHTIVYFIIWSQIFQTYLVIETCWRKSANLAVRREQLVDVTELLVDHQSKDAHLVGAFVVQLEMA